MVDFKITKTKLLWEQKNDMVHNYYYLFQGRIYNEDKTKYRKFKFVEWCDIFDAMEYFEKDYIALKDVKEFLTETMCSRLECIKDFNDENTLRDFYNDMMESIESWNKIACYWGV